jgi:single-stranded DNA-binding protein
MAIEGIVTGNMLTNPAQKAVNTPRGEVRITEFRMMSDVWKPGKDNEEPVQDESKTEPVQVTIWNERLGDAIAHNLRKGMRVDVTGSIYLSRTSLTDEDRAAGKKEYADMRCDASDVALKLNRVESVAMRQRATEQAPA